jgi:hypothetical protein
MMRLLRRGTVAAHDTTQAARADQRENSSVIQAINWLSSR